MTLSTAVPWIDVDGSEAPVEIDDRLPMRAVVIVHESGTPVRVVVAHEIIAEALAQGGAKGLNVERLTHAGWAARCMQLQREATR